MVGDVNFFMHPYLEDNEAEIDVLFSPKSYFIG